MNLYKIVTILLLGNHFVFGFFFHQNELKENSKKLTSSGKGILAIDESFETIGKRFETISIENSYSNRKSYRKLLLHCPDLNKYISGLILSEETFLDNYANPVQDIFYGVKVDCGLVPLNNDEKISTGLETLNERCKEYYEKGAKFVKWRVVYSIKNEQYPTKQLIEENSQTLTVFAFISQKNGLVPLIEPEILMDGDHSLEDCCQVQKNVLKSLYKKLEEHSVYLPGTILKTSMTLPGLEYKNKYTSEQIAEKTIETLKDSVPSSVPGIMFLSGGLSEEKSTEYLNSISNFDKKIPWKLSFSFGRALQNSCLKKWQGKEKNRRVAQHKLLERVKKNSQALGDT